MSSRRSFLQTSAAGAAAAGLSQIDLFSKLPRVSADEAKPDPKVVRFSAEIEPLVKLIEETPREKLLEEVGARIKKGASYREVLAALMLAGVRNIQPRPSVGFKFHSVLVVNSAHLASLSSPDEYRWLPIFWALDQFKSGQAADVQEGNWTMAPVEESAIPPAHKAAKALTEALDRWDEGATDAAAASIARTATAGEAFEIFARYGARDFRDIGHKAIYTANAFRTLQCIGWQHAEPVLRSLAYALLAHRGEGNPAENDFPADRPGKDNLSRVKKLRDDWQEGKVDDGATREILAGIRSANPSDMANLVVEVINRGIAPQSIWDGLFVGSGELLMRQPGIVGLHTLTSSNALRYAYDNTASDELRRWLLLQNAAFLTMFRDAMKSRGKIGDGNIAELAPGELPPGEDSLAKVFDAVSNDKAAAARLALAYAQANPEPSGFIQRARLLTFLKGKDSHDYKFSSAVLEDYRHLSPGWRDRYLAASVFNLRGSSGPDVPIVARTKQALT